MERSGGGGSILGGFIPHARFVTTMILLMNAALYLATGVYSMRSGNGNLMNLDHARRSGHSAPSFRRRFWSAASGGAW